MAETPQPKVPTPTSRDPLPGYVPAYETGRRLDIFSARASFPIWMETVFDEVAAQIESGNGFYPPTWDIDAYNWDREIGEEGISSLTSEKIYEWILSGGAANDPWVNSYIDPQPERKDTDFVMGADLLAQRKSEASWGAAYSLDVRQQQFNEAKYAIETSLKYGGNGGSSGGTYRGISSSSSAYDSRYSPTDLAYMYAELEMQKQLAVMGFDTQRDLQMMDQQFRQQMQQSEQEFQQRQLDLQSSQFQQTMGFQEEQFEYQKEQDLRRLGLDRASIVAGLSANPADMVQRDYFLRGGGSPQGQPTSVFSGEETGAPTTLPELMQSQGDQVGAGIQAGLSGGGVVPPEPPAALTQPPAPVPSLAGGSYGYVNEPKFIVGDSPNGLPTGNEEMVLNPTGAPIAVIPRNRMPGGR